MPTCASPQALLAALTVQLKPALAATFSNQLTGNALTAAAHKSTLAQIVAASLDDEAFQVFRWAMSLRDHVNQKKVRAQVVHAQRVSRRTRCGCGKVRHSHGAPRAYRQRQVICAVDRNDDQYAASA